MSNMSSAHSVVIHVSGETKAFTGQRLVRVIAKKDSQGKFASEHLTQTKSVSIPMLSAEMITPQILQDFMPQIVDMFNGFQDGIIADKIKEGASNILDSEIDFAAMATYLQSNAGSARVTKEVLQGWFMESYAEIAIEYICTALKWDAANLSEEQEKVLEQKINILRDMFAGFSSGKYNPEDNKCMAMIKFVAFAGDNADSRMQGMKTRCEMVMQKRKEETDASVLGF